MFVCAMKNKKEWTRGAIVRGTEVCGLQTKGTRVQIKDIQYNKEDATFDLNHMVG